MADIPYMNQVIDPIPPDIPCNIFQSLSPFHEGLPSCMTAAHRVLSLVRLFITLYIPQALVSYTKEDLFPLLTSMICDQRYCKKNLTEALNEPSLPALTFSFDKSPRTAKPCVQPSKYSRL